MSFMSTAWHYATPIDPLLLPLLQARSHYESSIAIERLLKQSADPIIEAAVRRYIAGVPVFVRGEAAEVRAETTFRLLERLDAREPIRDFRAYVKVTASRICWMRIAASRRQIPCTALLNNDEQLNGTPVPTEMVTAPDAFLKTERRAIVRAAWSEIQKLPSSQRAALLLNFQISDGRSGLLALMHEASVQIGDIAPALGLTASELETLIAILPLSDAEIGERLGRSAKEVNNMRLSARKRLVRRLREWID